MWVSLFAYENRAIPSLLQCFVQNDSPVTCLLPVGKAIRPALGFLGEDKTRVGDRFLQGNLDLRILPFLPQNQYDRLLWACDLNIVRGEDSFVRAQYAGRPVLWQAYVQEGDSHEKKVQAWLDLYLTDVSSDLAEGVRRLFMAWNKGEAVPPDSLKTLVDCRPRARVWADCLAGLPSLAESLVMFAKNKL